MGQLYHGLVYYSCLSHDARLLYFAYWVILLLHDSAVLAAAVVYIHRLSANVATQQLFGHHRVSPGEFNNTSADFETDPAHELHVPMLPKLLVYISSSDNPFLALKSIIVVRNEKWTVEEGNGRPSYSGTEWRLHIMVQGCSFVIIPVIMLGE